MGGASVDDSYADEDPDELNGMEELDTVYGMENLDDLSWY
jgi:hypothetical protein